MNNDDVIIDVPDEPDNASFKYEKITGQTGNDGEKNVQIMVSLKYLSNFWRTHEMSLINWEINILFTWSEKYIIVTKNVDDQQAKFSITDTKRYVSVVTLSAQDNAKLLQQIKAGFLTNNWLK